HCGKIAYSFEGEIGEVIDCNCSLCQKRGGLLYFIPENAFTLKTRRDDLGTYQFNKRHLLHHFCKSCGIAPFSEGADPKGNRMVAVNVRCVDELEISDLSIRPFNGRAL